MHGAVVYSRDELSLVARRGGEDTQSVRFGRNVQMANRHCLRVGQLLRPPVVRRGVRVGGAGRREGGEGGQREGGEGAHARGRRQRECAAQRPVA